MILHKMNEAQTARLYKEFPQEQYFALERLNSSSFSQLLRSIDAYIYSKKRKYEDSDAIRVGSSSHSLLEGTFENKYVIDNFDGRKKEDKERKAALIATGKSFVDAKEYEMMKTWENNAKLMPLLDKTVWDFVSEQTAVKEAVILFDKDGIEMKAMVDSLLPESNIFLDYKTTRSCNVRELETTVWKYFYFVQAAFYQSAIAEVYGRNFTPYYIFFEKEPPYGIRIFTFDPEYLAYGLDIIKQGKFLYKQYLQNKEEYNNKTLYGGYEVAPIIGKKPRWANENNETNDF